MVRHQLRKKQYYESPLDKVTGIGKVKKKNLLKHFGDTQKVRDASLNELNKDIGSNNAGDSIINIGTGAYMSHARNNLDIYGFSNIHSAKY